MVRVRPLERERELDRISVLLDRTESGAGAVLVVEGPSGIGKSRLLDEAAAMALDAGHDVLAARAGELECNYPFGLVLGLLEGRFARASPQDRAALFHGQAALAAPLLSPGDDDPGHASTVDEFALVHGLYWCVVGLSERRPVALIVDDAHWADELSLRFLNYLARRVDDVPVALILAVRTGDPTARSDLVAHLLDAGDEFRLHPAELSLDATRELLTGPVVPADAEEFIRASWDATGGNPFLLRELAKAICDDPVEWSAADPSRVAAFAPDAVARTVTRRLKRLGPEAYAFAQACAVFGDGASLARVSRLAGLQLDAGACAGDSLTQAHILSSADPASFAHPMIASAVRAECDVLGRQRAHLRAAQLLHAEGAGVDEVARHVFDGSPTHEPWAVEALHRAARAAARRGAPEVAVRYLRRVIDVLPSDRLTRSTLVDLGMVEAASGEETALTRFEQALTLIDEPAGHAQALYALGQTLFRRGRHEEALATFRRGVELVGDEDPDMALMFEGALHCVRILVHGYTMESVSDAAAALCTRAPRTRAERFILAPQALIRALSDPRIAAAADLACAALGNGALLTEQTSQGIAAILAIGALHWAGRAHDAQHAAEALMADARDRGDAVAFAEGALVRAICLLDRGLVTEAMADAYTAIEGFGSGWHAYGPTPQAVLCRCLIERGELHEAQRRLAESEADLVGHASVDTWFLAARGQLRLANGQAPAALDDLLETGKLLARAGITNPTVIPWRSWGTVAAHRCCEFALAKRLITEQVELARGYGLPGALGGALRARALLEDQPLDTLTEAVDVLETADAQLELARALRDLGMVLRRSGQRTASRRPLRRALELAHRSGAVVLGDSVRQELLASGAKPRRVPMTGIESLTPTELRIAKLAVQEDSNRKIAELLFVTKNTVAWHLLRVYRKLGVSSREELRKVAVT